MQIFSYLENQFRDMSNFFFFEKKNVGVVLSKISMLKKSNEFFLSLT